MPVTLAVNKNAINTFTSNHLAPLKPSSATAVKNNHSLLSPWIIGTIQVAKNKHVKKDRKMFAWIIFAVTGCILLPPRIWSTIRDEGKRTFCILFYCLSKERWKCCRPGAMTVAYLTWISLFMFSSFYLLFIISRSSKIESSATENLGLSVQIFHPCIFFA